MRIERTRNAGRNIVFGGILKIYQILVPFLIRTVMIYCMGVQYLGLNSLFTSILQVLNLAELGVGSAMVYSMYRPIAEDDEAKICALLKLYRRYYTIVGLVIAIAGVLLTPFVPRLIKSDLPAGLNVYILYLLNLAATVMSYWLYAYKSSLLQAHQRTDITSKITFLTTSIQYAIQILVLVLLRDYYIYVTVMLATQILSNVITAYVASRMYPRYRTVGELSEQEVVNINHRIRDLFTSKIGAVVVNSADTIVISAFLGLTMLAIYQNYFYILNALIGCIAIVYGACTAGIGNSIIVESKEKNFRDLNKFTFIIAWMAGFCTVCLLCLYQPFMDIWVGKELELEFAAVVCFCIYYFIYEINMLLNTYKDAAGIWHEDRFRPLVTAMSNLIMNLIMVQFWGIYGVLLSTVLSMLFVGMPWLLHNLFTVLFDRSQMPSYLRRLMLYTAITSVSCVVTYVICNAVRADDEWMTLIIRGIICCVIPNVIYLLAYRRMPEFDESLILVNRMLGGRLQCVVDQRSQK